MENKNLRKELVNYVENELSNKDFFVDLLNDNEIVHILDGKLYIEFSIGLFQNQFITLKFVWDEKEAHQKV